MFTLYNLVFKPRWLIRESNLSSFLCCLQKEINSFRRQFRTAISCGALSGHSGYMWPTAIYTPISSVLQVKVLLQPGGDQAAAEGAVGLSHCITCTLGHARLHCSPALAAQAQPGEIFCPKKRNLDGWSWAGWASWRVLNSVLSLKLQMWLFRCNALYWFSFCWILSDLNQLSETSNCCL